MAQIYLNKLAAAERLIDAAIGMSSYGVDPLAIFIVSASARKSLSEMKSTRGGSHVEDLYRWGLFYMARDYRLGRLSHDDLNNLGLAEIVEGIAHSIETGEIATADDLQMSGLPTDRQYWNEKNRPFNYLKHADRDGDALLDIETVDAERTILEASALFKQISGRVSAEMIKFVRQRL